MAANIHFLRKMACDELFDTVFFATGQRVNKTKNKDGYILSTPTLEVKIASNKRIFVNNDFCRNVPEAKWVIQHLECGPL